MDEDQYEVVKWYTRARRFPQLIGRTPDGTKIPGGPYTFTQVLGGAGFLVLAWKSLPIWGTFGLIGNAVVLLGATWLLVVGLGRLPLGARNPLSLAEGALRALTAPPAGRVAGRQVKIRRPHTARTVLTFDRTRVVRSPFRPARPVPAPPPVPATAPATTRAATPAATAGQPAHQRPTPLRRPVPTAPQLTSVQKVLAGLGTGRKET